MFLIVFGTFSRDTSGQVGLLSFVAAGVTTDVALNKADEVGSHLVQQAGQMASLTSSKAARDVQLLIENARWQLHDELDVQWDKLDSQKLSILKEIDKYIVELNAGMEKGGAIEENAYLDLKDFADALPLSKKEPILRTIKGATIYFLPTNGNYRVSLKGNIFNQEYGEPVVFRGNIQDKNVEKPFGTGVKIVRDNSGYDVSLVFDSAVFKNDFEDSKLVYIPVIIKTKFPDGSMFHWKGSGMLDVTYKFTLQLLPKFPVTEYEFVELNEEPTVDKNNIQEKWGDDYIVSTCGSKSGCNSWMVACAFAPPGSQAVQVIDRYDSAQQAGFGTWEWIKVNGESICENFHQQSHTTPRNIRIKISYYPPDKHLVANDVKLQEVQAADVPATKLAYGTLYVAYFNNKKKSFRLRLKMFTGEYWEATPLDQWPRTDDLKIRDSDKSDDKEFSLVIQPGWQPLLK